MAQCHSFFYQSYYLFFLSTQKGGNCFELFRLWNRHEFCLCYCFIRSFDYCRSWLVLFIKNFSMERCVVLPNIPKVNRGYFCLHSRTCVYEYYHNGSPFLCFHILLFTLKPGSRWSKYFNPLIPLHPFYLTIRLFYFKISHLIMPRHICFRNRKEVKYLISFFY
ncbi:hypothetical protein ABH966_004460 [Lysinibacillus sp. RC46]